MVFLRLTVKIYPPEQIQASSSFSLRSILSSDDAARNSSAVPAGKPANFLLVLQNPEDVTLGGLAKMIQEKWTKLRPTVEPLQIKKMLDDDHDTDDLDVDMTAADVFVDRGLAQIDARDQRGTLRVIQKPTPYSPARFPSVTLDWDAAAEDYERRIQDKREAATNSVHKFPTIPEEDSQAGSVSGSQDDDRQHMPTPTTPAHQTDELERRRDMPVLSVEKEHEIPGSPARWDEQPHVQEQDSRDNNEKTIEATPQHRRFESQELGGSPTPMRPFAPSSEKTAATSQSRASASRGRAANRTINRIASGSKSPPLGKGQHLAEQTPPVRRKTRYLTRRRDSQLMKPVEDDEDEGEANEQDNGRQEDEGEEKDNGDNVEEGSFDDDGDVAMDDGGDTFTSATEEAPEQDLANGDAPETFQARLGKRKKSQEDLQSNKEPRLDRPGTPTQETPEPRNSSPSAMRKREIAPSFSGPGRRPSITEQHSLPKSGLGLGITKSPPRKQSTKHDFSNNSTKAPKLVLVDSINNREQPSSQKTVPSAPVSFSSARKSLTQNDSTPARPQTPADKVKSALRKEALTDKRRSVSFSEKNSVFPVTDDSRSRSPLGPAAKEPGKAKDKREKPPTAGVTVYPGGVTTEKLQQIFEEQQREAEKKKQEQEEMDREMREAEECNASPEYLELLAESQRTRAYISENKNSGRQKTQKQVTSYRAKLDAQLRELEYLKANPNGHPKTPEKLRKKKKRASQAAAEEKSEEINTPSSTAKESAKKTKAARCESSSKRSPAKSPPKETESGEAAPTETTNGDSAQTTEAEASQEPETAPAETPSPSKLKASPADKAQNKEPVTASPRGTRRSHRSLRAFDGADATGIHQPGPQPEPQREREQEKGPEEQQVNEQEIETEEELEREQEGEQGQEQPEDPEPGPEPQSQDEEEDGDETDEEQEQGQEKEQIEAQQEPEQQFEPEQEPAQEREPEQEQQPDPEPEVEQEAEPQSEQQPQEPEESEEQPQEPEMVPETSQPQPQEPQEPQQAKLEQPGQKSPQKPQSQQSRLLSQEQSQSFPMSDDVNLPEMETIRTLDQSKKPEEQPAPQPTPEEPKPTSLEQGKDQESSSEDDDETDSETGSGSDSDSGSGSGSDDDEEQGPELTKADLLRRANGTNGANGTSSARNGMTKSPAPSQQQLPQSQPLPQNRYSSPRGSSQPPAQSQPQPHIQPFQSVNRISSARASLQGLRNVITAQKQNYDAQLQEARMATVTRKKDVFDPPSDSESEDDSESDSDSDSDSDSNNVSGADDGDIQSSGTVGKLRKALQKK